MANNVRLEFASRTDIGQVRSDNEDAIALSPAHGFAVLADGMGGYSAGEVASNIATTVCTETIERGLEEMRAVPREQSATRGEQIRKMMVDAIQHANSAILEAARKERRYRGMGTTLVTALFHDDKVTIAHVGDSRAYRFRSRELTQLTRDHSLLQEQVDAGLVDPEMARFAEHKNLVTRAVGVGEDMEVEIHDHDVEPGDLYLLCSDGLSDLMSSREIAEILVSFEGKIDAACDALVQRANNNGGHDNISAVLMKLRSRDPFAPSLVARFLSWLA